MILNKDSKPIITTPEAIGIHTDLHLANELVEKPKDIGKMLTEQQATAQATANIGAAMETYTRRQAVALQNKAKEARDKGDWAAANAYISVMRL